MATESESSRPGHTQSESSLPQSLGQVFLSNNRSGDIRSIIALQLVTNKKSRMRQNISEMGYRGYVLGQYQSKLVENVILYSVKL